MSNKEIQKERMKSFFKDATKELIKAEGIQSVSVRNIAEKAGYSYATLYNYYKDVKELVFECVEDFLVECTLFIEERRKEKNDPVKRIKEFSWLYISFLMEYPGVYDLFFLEKKGNGALNTKTTNSIKHFLIESCESDWDMYAFSNDIDEADKLIKMKMWNFMVTGQLLYYMNRNLPSDYLLFKTCVDQTLAGLFR